MMKHPNPDILLYIGMADAYAAAVEYNDKLTFKALRFERYVKHPTHGLEAGRYTDDTEMSVANAMVLLLYDYPYEPLMFADGYVCEFIRGGKRNGYARGFQQILERVNNGGQLVKALNPISSRNGAAMRSAVLGVLPTVEQVLATAEVQAKITHDTPEGIFSSQAVALMAHYALYEHYPLADVGEYCMWRMPQVDLKRFGYVFEQRWSGGPITTGGFVPVSITTVHAVSDLVQNESSLMDMLKQTILWGGDTDSVASIAWGIASARHQDEQIPEFMERDLENGSLVTGASYLRELGNQLMKKYQSP